MFLCGCVFAPPCGCLRVCGVTHTPHIHSFVLDRYPTFERLTGKPMSPIARMATGMVFTGLSLVAAGTVQIYLDHAADTGGEPLHVAWQVPQYFFLSCGEVMASITGLEFAFTQAPDGFRGAVMAGWFCTQAAGNAVVAVVALAVNATSTISPLVYFGFAACMVLCVMGFLWVTRGYHYQKQQRRRSHVPAQRRNPPAAASGGGMPRNEGAPGFRRPQRVRSNSTGSVGSR